MAGTKALNDEQQHAVLHKEGPLLIIAGAGTGKTTVITQRITRLILEEKIAPSEILALTFTEKAAHEMEERVDISLPYGYSQLWIETFHSFCDRLLRNEGIHIGLNPGYTLATEAQAILFLRKNLFKLKLDYFRPLSNPYKFLQGFLTHVNRLKDDDSSPDDYLDFAKKLEKDGEDTDEIKKTIELAHAYKIYEELKTKEGIMDFSDLITNTLKILRTRKNILSSYQKKFKYILVDEFQDTNFAQNELAILLAGEKQNITIVADDDQSIYKWRGAAMSNIMQFRDHFPTAKIITLTKNYRSTQEVLDRAYQVIQNNNPDRLEIKEQINKKLIGMRNEKGKPVELIVAARAEQEAELVIKKILELTKTKQYVYKDFAILVRANDHGQPFIRALERSRIPYQFLGPGRLFHQEEIKDLIAYLKVLSNFEDNASLYRVITMPLFGLDAKDIAALLNFAKKKNLKLFETLEECDQIMLKDETKEKVKQLVAMVHKHLKHVPRESAGQILYYFFEDSQLLHFYLSAEKPEDERRAQNVAKFFEKLKSFEAQNKDASVFAIVDWIELSMELGESPLATETDWSENNAVNILTIHSSKGLEFPVVFLVSLVTQRFPSRDRKEQIPVPEKLIKEVLPVGDYNLQEERRLFYVGVTRAKDLLFLTSAQYYGEGRRERKISPFVYETLGETEVNKQLERKREEQYVKQLSFLDGFMEDETPQPTRVTKPIQPITTSYSQIQTFLMCPLHYKLRYLLKMPFEPVAALSFGTSLHAFLKDYYSLLIQKTTVTKEIREQLLKKNWVRDGYGSREHEEESLHHAKKVIANYIQQNGNLENLPIALEMPFQFGIQHIKVLGRIDRIDKLADGRIEIIDYKTGDKVPDEKKIRDDMQLTMYALAATKVPHPLFRKTPEEIILTIYNIEKGVKLSTTRTADHLKVAEEFLLQKTEEIQNSEYLCSGSMFCAACEYKMLCQSLR